LSYEETGGVDGWVDVSLALGSYNPRASASGFRSTNRHNSLTRPMDQLLGPIALYPDPLIAEILPAATLPNEIVMADRYIGQGGDPTKSQSRLGSERQALAHYPNVLKWMDDNLAWTTELGKLSSPADYVMNSVQRLRAKRRAWVISPPLRRKMSSRTRAY